MAEFGFDEFNPNVLFGIKGPQLPDPYLLAQRRLTLSQLQDAQLMRQLVMANQARQFASQDAYASAVPSLESSNYSPEAVQSALSRFPAGAGDILTRVDAARKAQADAAKAAAETADKTMATKVSAAKLLANQAFQLSNDPNLSPQAVQRWTSAVASNGLERLLPAPQFQDWTNPQAVRKTLATAGSSLFEANQQMERAQAQQKLDVEIPGIRATTAKTQVETGLLPMEAQAKVTTANAAASNAARGWAEYRQPNLQHVSDAFGGVLAFNPRSGQANPVTDATGNPIGNPFTGGGPAGAAAGSQLSGQALLDTLNPQIASQIKALTEGRQPFPAAFALKTPYWQQMLGLVSQYDPSFDAINYNARAKTRNAFVGGKEAGQINALQTVIGHLGQLSDVGDALQNSSFPVYNMAANFLAKQTGDPRVNQFNITRKAVVDELTRVYRGTGGSEKDIETWTQQINDAGSPAQLHGALASIGNLLESKIAAMGTQYQQGMGTTAQPLQLLTPDARNALTKLEKRAGGASVAPGGPSPSSSIALPPGIISVTPLDQPR